MNPEPTSQGTAWGPRIVASLVVLVHLAINLRDMMFRDEFYYLACADHLGWGYVDHPPLSIAILKLMRTVFGASLIAVRLAPALAGAAVVLLAARLAREWGGSRSAQFLAAVCVAVAPIYASLFGYFSMNSFDMLFWTLGALLLARLAATPAGRSATPAWLFFGAVCGLGLLNKISILFFGCGAAVALVLTPLRQHLRTRGPWLAIAVAALLFLPHVVWQVQHGWPTLEFIHNAENGKNTHASLREFFGAQVLLLHPLNAPIWILGLGALLWGRIGHRDRGLGIVYLTAFTVLAARGGKAYYLAGAYPPLLAAGAITIDRMLARGRAAWVHPVLVTALVASGLLLLPFSALLLPVDTFVAYQHALHLEAPREENHTMGPLPQFLADRCGWQEMTQAVVKVYQSLPEADRAKTLIVGSNYGEAGALLYYGRRLGLPAAVSQHNSFYLWGPGTMTPEVVITIGQAPEGMQDTFESIVEAARIEAPYAMPYETRQPVCICRGWKIPLDATWKDGKHFE
jgi:hypothetical protein